VKSFKYGSSSSTVVRKSWVMASSGIMVVPSVRWVKLKAHGSGRLDSLDGSKFEIW
jgi:hypothetical protein